MSLEKLKIVFEENLYDAGPGQGLLHWGVDWKRHRKYAKLDDARAELKFQGGGRTAGFQVGDYWARDFRLPPASPALEMGC